MMNFHKGQTSMISIDFTHEGILIDGGEASASSAETREEAIEALEIFLTSNERTKGSDGAE